MKQASQKEGRGSRSKKEDKLKDATKTKKWKLDQNEKIENFIKITSAESKNNNNNTQDEDEDEDEDENENERLKSNVQSWERKREKEKEKGKEEEKEKEKEKEKESKVLSNEQMLKGLPTSFDKLIPSSKRKASVFQIFPFK